MKFATLLAAAAIAAGTGPALAQSDEINQQARLAAARAQGCAIQQVHTPAGKPVHAAPIVRCSRANPAAAQSVSAVARPDAAPRSTQPAG